MVALMKLLFPTTGSLVVLVLLFTTTKSAVARQAWQSAPSSTPGQVRSNPKQDDILVVSADSLVDRDVYDRTGRRMGEVEYVAVDTRTGDTPVFVVEVDALKDQLFAVPWAAIDTGSVASGVLRVNVSLDQFITAPALVPADLGNVLEPRPVTGRSSPGRPLPPGSRARSCGT